MGIINLPDEVKHDWVIQYEKALQKLLKKTYIIPIAKTLVNRHYATYTQCEITIRNVRVVYSTSKNLFWISLYIRPKDCKGEIIDYNNKIKFIGDKIDVVGFDNIIKKVLSFVQFQGKSYSILIYKDSNEWYASNSNYKKNRIDY